MTKTKVMQQKNEQFLTTIPKTLAEALRLKKGDELDWGLQGKDILIRT